MGHPIKYMIDANGEKTSVMVPLKTWERINAEYSKLQNKIRVFTGINEGLAEIKVAKKTGRKLQNLKDFLRESKRQSNQ